jgi:hypothetical protein
MPEEEAVQQELSVEEKARQRGWVPTEEWKGDPDRALDAETFLARAEDNLPLLKSNVQLLERRLADTQKELRETKDSFQQYNTHIKQAHERELTRLKKELRGAVEEGDTVKFDAIQGEIDALRPTAAVPQAPAEGGIDNRFNDQQALSDWKNENSWWYEEDVDMAEYANKVDTHLANVKRDLTHREHLEELTKRVKRRFPDRFDTSEPSKKGKPPAVQGGENYAGKQSNNGKKSYADLPGEAKIACDKFVKQGWLTKEQYIKDYFGEG